MEDTHSTLQSKLKSQWAGRDFEELVAGATRALMRDRGDWDPPEGVIPRPDMIRLAIGIPDSDTLPRAALLDATRQAIEAPGEGAFVYGFGMGYPKLRAMLAERYSAERGLPVTEDWFQLTNGSAGAIDLICRTLIDPGDVIIAESPTYMGTLRNFKGVRADVRAVSMDEDGLRVDELDALIDALKFEGKKIKLIYTISTFHNPTGATLSQARRIALLEVAARHNILILDDDAYGELSFAARPPTSLTALSGGYGVITVGTFSKILATGLRIGWIHGEPGIVQVMGQMRFAMGLNQLMVRAIAQYMQASQLDEHILKVRGIYEKKMNRLADALEHHAGEFVEFTRPAGGFYLWANLTGGLAAADVWRTSAEEGVAFTPGVNFFASRQDPTGQHIRIAYPWTPLGELEEGARRIGIACRRVSKGDVTP